MAQRWVGKSGDYLRTAERGMRRWLAREPVEIGWRNHLAMGTRTLRRRKVGFLVAAVGVTVAVAASGLSSLAGEGIVRARKTWRQSRNRECRTERE